MKQDWKYKSLHTGSHTVPPDIPWLKGKQAHFTAPPEVSGYSHQHDWLVQTAKAFWVATVPSLLADAVFNCGQDCIDSGQGAHCTFPLAQTPFGIIGIARE